MSQIGTISVLVVDDHPIVRDGLRRIINEEENMKVVGAASNGQDAIEKIEALRPDIVILNIKMPVLDGIEALEKIRKKQFDVKVILFSQHQDTAYVRRAARLGAEGYLLKAGATKHVLEAIRTVANGGNHYSPLVTREIMQQLRSPNADAEDDPFSALSSREREVLRQIAEGLSGKEIAVELGVSLKTVEAHRTNLMRKLGFRKATELVRYAIRHQLIEA